MIFPLPFQSPPVIRCESPNVNPNLGALAVNCKIHKNIALKGGVCPVCAKIGPPSGKPTTGEVAVCPFPVDPQAPTPGETPDTTASPDPTDSGGDGGDSDGGNGD